MPALDTAVHRPHRDAPEHIAVLRALKLGDMLCAVPALRALRAGCPDAKITLIGLPWARAFAERYGHYVDDFHEFPGYPGLPEQKPRFDRLPGFLARMHSERFDLAIQMHGRGEISNTPVNLVGARLTAGFHPAGQPCPDPERFLPYPDRGLEVRRLLALTEFLGFPSRGEHLEFPLREEDHRALHAVHEARDLAAGPYVCIHPGASVPERRWPPERFAAVADGLAAEGLRPVLTATAAEADLTRAVRDAASTHCLDLAGRTGLGALAALVSRARLLICNDTGVSHMAAALRVPSVVISTGDNPERWAPMDRARHHVLCRHAGVEAREVISEAEALLRGEAAHAADAA